MDQYLKEIMGQSKAAKQLYAAWNQDTALDELGELYHKDPRPLLFIGMGSSNYAPTIIRGRLSRAKIQFQLFEAGEFFHYEMEIIDPSSWVIAISQSGESYETRVAVENLKGKVARIIVLTNERNSSIARLADSLFLLEAGEEFGSTTKTFTNTLLGLHLLANALERNETVTDHDIIACIEMMGETLVELQNKIDGMVDHLNISTTSSPDPIHIIARGPMLSTALQSSLILAETTDLFTVAMSGATFRHGPYELSGPEHRAVILAPSGKTQHLLLSLAKELHERGSKVVLLSDTTESFPFYHLNLPRIHEDLAPVLYFLPIELFGHATAKRRGRVPGMMRNMGKVTLTE